MFISARGAPSRGNRPSHPATRPRPAFQNSCRLLAINPFVICLSSLVIIINRCEGACMSTNPKIAEKITEIEIVAEEPRALAGGFKIFNRVLDWITSDRTQLINITDRINEIVRKSGVRDGIVHLQSLHTTTAVFLNEWQDALLHDVKRFLEEVVARELDWRHNDPEHSDCERKNADSHMRGMLD